MCDHYELTAVGERKCEIYIENLKAKRKEILDANKDTAEDTLLPTVQELFDDALDYGIDEDGEIYNSWGVTDHYEADEPICLKFEVDFIAK